MSQPFVVSLKLIGDGTSAEEAARRLGTRLDDLQRKARELSTGATPIRLDQMAGLTPGEQAAYGKLLDDLKARYVPLYDAERQHKQNLGDISRAYAAGALTSAEMSAAVEREKVAHQTAIAALNQHTDAIGRNNRANFQRTNLLFQLQDIAVSLASGMNPLMVAAQQGSQISMIYGPEEGGLGKALSETGKIATGVVTKLWPIATALAIVGAGVAGLRSEMERVSGKAISFGDVLLGIFQTFGDLLVGTFRPQIDAVATWISVAWEWVKSTTRDVGNFVVREIVGATDIIATAIGSLPEVFIVAAQASANGFTNTIITAFRWVQEQFNGLLTGINGLAGSVGLQKVFEPIKVADYVDFDFGGSNAEKRLAAGWAGLADRLKDVAGTDYMGQFFGDVLDHAVDNFSERTRDKKLEQKLVDAYQRILDGARQHILSARVEQQALGLDQEAADRLRYSFDLLNQARQAGIALTPRQTAELRAQASAMAETDAATRRLTEIYNFGREGLRGFFSDLLQGARDGQSVLESFGNAVGNVFDSIAERALQMAADGIWNMIFAAVFGAATGTSIGVSGIRAGGLGAAAVGGAGFADGGWTGGTRNRVQGVVHGEEFVVRAGPAAANRGLLEAINSGGTVHGGSFTFAPVNQFTLTGGQADMAAFAAMLDQRDAVLAAQFEDKVAAYLDNPMRRSR